jgi:hypothetical protein
MCSINRFSKNIRELSTEHYIAWRQTNVKLRYIEVQGYAKDYTNVGKKVIIYFGVHNFCINRVGDIID